MVSIKCKMCGGTLEFEQDATIGTCEFCGSKQTLPKTADDVLANLFNRANNLRLKCEFDKALSIYEKIVEQDDSESEAHWGIVLCRYGIEYVEDPATKTRIPTCHRTLYDAVTRDADYQAAIDYSDTLQQTIYEKEARAIDKIQKDILAIVQKEEPFDVFICYKETDENGKRTKDSVLANDIYHQLTQEGFKVFYAAITLEDKLGQEYEPYIFAALSTAKVMLVVGSKPEYFNAVWVRNEWSRFLNFMKTDRSKLLIPCYKDMDAYDLPEEFSHLQAQDMSKIGFIFDVVRGISKVIKKIDISEKRDAKEPNDNVNIELGHSISIIPLLERASIFLEDENWTDAESYFEKVLDIEPKNAKAYLGKLLVDLRVKDKEHLRLCHKSFRENYNYKKICQFGDDILKNEIEKILIEIEETQKKDVLLEKLLNILSNYSKEKENQIKNYELQMHLYFEKIKNSYDKSKLEEMYCIITQNPFFEQYKDEFFLKIYNEAIAINNTSKNEYDYSKAVELLNEVKEYYDVEELIDSCLQKQQDLKNKREQELNNKRIYTKACQIMNGSISEMKNAIAWFSEIIDYADSKEKLITTQKNLEAFEKMLNDNITQNEASESKKKNLESCVYFIICILLPVITLIMGCVTSWLSGILVFSFSVQLLCIPFVVFIKNSGFRLKMAAISIIMMIIAFII